MIVLVFLKYETSLNQQPGSPSFGRSINSFKNHQFDMEFSLVVFHCATWCFNCSNSSFDDDVVLSKQLFDLEGVVPGEETASLDALTIQQFEVRKYVSHCLYVSLLHCSLVHLLACLILITLSHVQSINH